MIRRLHHPLWTHIPAALMVLTGASVLALAGPWPARIPMHFDFAGRVNRWGAPWELWLVAVLLPALYVLGSAVIDELSARCEYRRAFNWFALLDELIVSFSVSMALGYALSLPDFDRLWPQVLRAWAVLGVGGVAAAVLLERLRPWHRSPEFPRPPTRRPSRRISQSPCARAERGPTGRRRTPCG